MAAENHGAAALESCQHLNANSFSFSLILKHDVETPRFSEMPTPTFLHVSDFLLECFSFS